MLKQFREKCQEHNLKCTVPRTLIYKELSGDRSHPTVDAIYKRIHKKHPSISFDTVNRTLLTFAEIGIIKNIGSFGRQKRFDADTSDHQHMNCIKCDRIIDFNFGSIENLKLPSKSRKKHKILSKRLIVQILCSDCIDRKKKE